MGEGLLPAGSRVFVTCAGGRVVENVVWADYGDVVLVCSADQFERLKKGYQTPMPIGFHKSDVVIQGEAL